MGTPTASFSQHSSLHDNLAWKEEHKRQDEATKTLHFRNIPSPFGKTYFSELSQIHAQLLHHFKMAEMANKI